MTDDGAADAFEDTAARVHADTAARSLADTAARAVDAGGEYLRERFASGDLDAAYTATDVKTQADRAAEDRVLSVIRETHPDHRITAEETGDHPGDGDYRWLVDALDGTNNFAAGIPTFGVAATALDDAGPAAAAVAVPVLEDLYVATRDGGVRYDGDRVSVADGDTVDPARASVGMIIGEEVVSGGVEREEWDAIRAAVEAETKRAIPTWAPVVYWGLLARGRLDGFVCYYPDEREHAAGRLLAREADAVERADGPLTVFGADEATVETLWTAAADALDRQGKRG